MDGWKFSSKQPDFPVIFLHLFKLVLRNSSPGLTFELAAFSLIFSPVLVPDYFQRNLFVCYAS